MRKLLAIWAAKFLVFVGVILRKKASSAPGKIALKICPDIIKRLSSGMEKGIIVVCGTNGKTTTNNLLNTALIKCGYKTVCNNLGANMLQVPLQLPAVFQVSFLLTMACLRLTKHMQDIFLII